MNHYPTQSSSSHAKTPALLRHLRAILRKGWMYVFAQKRTREKAIDLAVTVLVLHARRHTLSQAILFNKEEQSAWNRLYRLFSQSPWEARDLFRPAVRHAVSMLDATSSWCGVALDDTNAYKTGKKIPNTAYVRDPLSPPFHVNLRLGQRFIQTSMLLPLYTKADVRARAIPIRFEIAPFVKKPGKKASQEEIAQYKQARKQNNLCAQAAAMIGQIRQDLDGVGSSHRKLLMLGDGGYCNRRIFAAVDCERTHLLVRCRKDAVLCMPAAPESRKFYGEEKFTPEQVRQSNEHPWKTTTIFYGGKWREIQFKRIDGVLWQRGAKRHELTLFDIRPLAYRTTKAGKTYYRDPAFVLTTATDIDSTQALQMYFDRWQIEVNHREEKHDLGVGQAQVRSPQSVARHPAFVVAAYAMMQLAALECYGPTRNEQYLPLPRWRTEQPTPSCRDMSALLRHQLHCEQMHCSQTGPPPMHTKMPNSPHRVALHQAAV